jgi:3-hydroxyacyl-CoA dehydrogenase
MNTIGGDAIAIIYACLRRLQLDFDGMIIANQAENFSAGANLLLLLVNAQDQDWDEIDLAVRQFQHVNMAIKQAAKPIIAVPQGMTLGGGCEIALHARLIHASAEAYLGLVEKNVGLIPAGGGTKEMMIRANERVASGVDATMNAIFEIIATAKVSTSAEDARKMGFLRPMDKITMNRDRLIGDAKQTALEMARAGHQPATSAPIQVLGEPFLSAMKSGVEQDLRAGNITEYDALIVRKLAFVMAGGKGAPRAVSEQYLPDLEREAFVSLCGEKKTQERIAHMLKTGKPLHN